MAAKQSAQGLNRGVLCNFWSLKSAKYLKFTEEFVCENIFLSKKRPKVG